MNTPQQRTATMYLIVQSAFLTVILMVYNFTKLYIPERTIIIFRTSNIKDTIRYDTTW